MLFNKKEKEIKSPFEIKRLRKRTILMQEWDNIQKTTFEIFLLNQTIEIYPFGVERDGEVQRRNELQQKLLNQIAYYDELRQEYLDFCNQNNYETKVFSSHEIISLCIKDHIMK